MKKLFLAAAIAVFGFTQAQEGFKLGAHIGIPTGDAGDVYSFKAGVDAAYLWPVATNLNLGIASGYSVWFGKDVSTPFGNLEMDNLNLVPVALSGQYNLTPEFSLMVDLGYGFLFADGESDGGFYYHPKAAYHFGPSEVYVGYSGVSKDGATLSSINLGYAYTFGK